VGYFLSARPRCSKKTRDFLSLYFGETPGAKAALQNPWTAQQSVMQATKRLRCPSKEKISMQWPAIRFVITGMRLTIGKPVERYLSSRAAEKDYVCVYLHFQDWVKVESVKRTSMTFISDIVARLIILRCGYDEYLPVAPYWCPAKTSEPREQCDCLWRYVIAREGWPYYPIPHEVYVMAERF